MSDFTRDDVRIAYEDTGDGFPLLLLAPGGLNSRIERWPNASINPLELFPGEFRLIAMDQRNAGNSVGPIDPVHPWDTYVDDQLALLDHLQIESFVALGCCIGCSYALKLAQRAPERLHAAVLQQPIGIIDSNRELWLDESREWILRLRESRPDIDPAEGENFCQQMWNIDGFVGSVSREFVGSCPTPILVLPGVNKMHPNEIGHEIATLAPKSTLVEPWKETDEQVARAVAAVRAFLHENH